MATLNIVYLWNTHIKREKLKTLPIEDVKALWDDYDGCNSPGGFEGEEIHLVLNLRGCGDYCSV